MGDVPALVGVDHQRAGAYDLADPGQALDVLLDVRLADLDLEGLEAVRLPALHLIDERIERLVQIDAAGIGEHALATRPQDGDQRLFHLLRDQVPKGDVDRRERGRRDAAAAQVVDVMPALVPEAARRDLLADDAAVPGPCPGVL